MPDRVRIPDLPDAGLPYCSSYLVIDDNSACGARRVMVSDLLSACGPIFSGSRVSRTHDFPTQIADSNSRLDISLNGGIVEFDTDGYFDPVLYDRFTVAKDGIYSVSLFCHVLCLTPLTFVPTDFHLAILWDDEWIIAGASQGLQFLPDVAMASIGHIPSQDQERGWFHFSVTLPQVFALSGQRFRFRFLAVNGDGTTPNPLIQFSVESVITIRRLLELVGSSAVIPGPLPLLLARSGLRSVEFAVGNILTVGGEDLLTATIVPDAEILDWNARTVMSTNPLITARYQSTFISGPDGKAYCFGGSSPLGAPVDSAEVWSPITQAWQGRSPMSVARQGACSALHPSGEVIIFGGSDGVFNLDSVEKYNTITDSYTLLSVLPAGRYGAGACNGPGGVIYVAGGFNGIGEGQLWEYDPLADTYAVKASMLIERYLHGLVSDGVYVYAIGGQTILDPATNLCERYDPVGDVWVSIASLPLPVSDAGVVMGSDGNIYVVGGFDGVKAISYVLRYRISLDRWDVL